MYIKDDRVRKSVGNFNARGYRCSIVSGYNRKVVDGNTIYFITIQDLINPLQNIVQATGPDCALLFDNGSRVDLLTNNMLRFDLIPETELCGDCILISDSNEKRNTNSLTFGEALEAVKAGKKISREGWNGKGLFVVYQKGYPDGIPCNKQTAEAWGLTEGELFRCEPYLQINTVDGSHAMWVPSSRDCLAEDWMILD